MYCSTSVAWSLLSFLMLLLELETRKLCVRSSKCVCTCVRGVTVCKISLSFRFRISLSDMTNYKSAFGKVCRIKNRQTFKSMPILNSAYHAVKYAELRIGILLKICRFVIRHITTWYGMPN